MERGLSEEWGMFSIDISEYGVEEIHKSGKCC